MSAVGSLAGSGTLGFLIPPSNIMIIYGVLGDVSVSKLFTAGFIPGFLLAACFMAWIMIHTAINPALVPASERKIRIASGRPNIWPRSRSWGRPYSDRLRAGVDVWRSRHAIGGRRRRCARRLVRGAPQGELNRDQLKAIGIGALSRPVR